MAQLEVCLDGVNFEPVGAQGTITSITAGTGLTGGTITTSGTINIEDTTVTPGTATYPTSITFNAQGQATDVVSGSAPVTLVTGTANEIEITGTTTPVLSLPNDMVTPGDFTVNSTGFIKIPVGTTLERPVSPTIGMMRINTDL